MKKRYISLRLSTVEQNITNEVYQQRCTDCLERLKKTNKISSLNYSKTIDTYKIPHEAKYNHQ